jgi:hypothetical protein
MSVCIALVSIGAAALRVLGRAILDRSVVARRRACLILGQIDDPRSVGLVIGAVADESADVRIAVANALAYKRRESRVPAPLRSLLRDRPDVRAAAARALGRLGVPAADAEEEVLRLIAGDDGSVEFGAPRLSAAARPILERYARNGDAIARRYSVAALGHRREDSNVLMEALNDEDERVRMTAVMAHVRVHQTLSEPAEGRDDLTDERWETLYGIDEAKVPAPQLLDIPPEPRPGDVVRLWDEKTKIRRFHWFEIVVATETHVGLRMLETDGIECVTADHLRQCGRLHPDPVRLRILDAEARIRRDARDRARRQPAAVR